MLHELDGLLLVGSLLVRERRLQLMLQITVGRKGKTAALLALGIQLDEFAGNILDGALRGVLHALPRSRTELIDARRRIAVLILVARNAVQRMDIDQQHIAVPVFELHGLVHLAVLHRPHQTAETPHAVVDMHHVVARLQLVQLRHGKCLTAVYLTPKRITLITFEQLVVGIETKPEPVVHETFVQGDGKCRELHLRESFRCEDIPQALYLRLVIGKDADFVTRFASVMYIFGKQLITFIESGLRQGIENDRTGGGQLLRAVPPQQQRPVLQRRRQLPGTRHTCIHPFGRIGLGQHLFTDVVHPAQRMAQVVGPPHGFAGKLRKRHAVAGAYAPLHVRHYLHLFELLRGELRSDVETADRLHLVAEKVDTAGPVLGKRKDIDDTAAQGVLPRFIDEIHLREAILLQHIGQETHLHPLAATNRHRPPAELSRIGHLLGQSLRIGTDNQMPFPFETAEGIQRRRALDDTRRILLPELYGTLVTGRKEHHPLFAQQGVEVVHQVGCRIPVPADEDVHATPPLHDRSGIQRIGRTRHAFQYRHLSGRRRSGQFLSGRRGRRALQYLLHRFHTRNFNTDSPPEAGCPGQTRPPTPAVRKYISLSVRNGSASLPGPYPTRAGTPTVPAAATGNGNPATLPVHNGSGSRVSSDSAPML